VRIRRATGDDAATVAAIQVRSWRAAYAGLMPQEYLDSLSIPDRAARWREWIDSLPGGVRVWLAEESEGPVGFASTGPSRDSEPVPGTAEVYALYLEPSVIGTGRGRELFGHAVDDLRAQGYQRAELWVLTGNDRAQRFYERAGWLADGSEKLEPFDEIVVPEVRYWIEL
jgi:GNAT superfamily N-acetyltransferase